MGTKNTLFRPQHINQQSYQLKTKTTKFPSSRRYFLTPHLPHHTFPNTRKKYMGGYWKRPLPRPHSRTKHHHMTSPPKGTCGDEYLSTEKNRFEKYLSQRAVDLDITDGRTDRVARIIRAEKKNFFSKFFFCIFGFPVPQNVF